MADHGADLNDTLFPPHYSKPYPVTRGIQVEVAAIILLFLVGVMSQLKVWKIVKKRREKKEAYRLAEERRQEQTELDLGRRLEEGNIQEKIRWEATYGEHGKQKHIDSSLGTDTTVTPRKASSSAHEDASLEKGHSERSVGKETNKHTSRAQGPTRITVRVASEDSIYELPSDTTETLLPVEAHDQRESESGPISDSAYRKSASLASSRASSEETKTKPVEASQNLLGPEVTALPLQFTTLDGSPGDDDRSSVATYSASECLPMHPPSGSGLSRNLSKHSKRRSNTLAHTDTKRTARLDDDQASVVATVDDIDDYTSSRGGASGSELPTTPSDEGANDVNECLLSSGPFAPLTSDNLTAGDQGVDEKGPSAVDRIKAFINPESEEDRGRGYLESSLKPSSPPPPAVPERSPSRISARSSAPSRISPALGDQLPEGASKIVTAYRTNEWAKHLEQAEHPAVDELKQSRGGDDVSTSLETAAPVNVNALQQTSFTADPAHVPSKPKHRPQQLSLERSASPRDSLPSQQKYSNPRASLRRSSMGKILESSSQSPRRSKHRSSSTPMNTSPLAGSPIEEGVEMTFPKRMSAHPTNAMMANRSSTLQRQYSSSSITRANPYSSLGPSRNQGPNLNAPMHPQSLPKDPHRLSRPDLTPRTSAMLIPSTDPPRNRESAAANWRSSLQQDPRASNLALSQELDGKREELLTVQRRASAAELEKIQKEEAEKCARISRGDLLEAHQRAMRKMQGSVKL